MAIKTGEAHSEHMEAVFPYAFWTLIFVILVGLAVATLVVVRVDDAEAGWRGLLGRGETSLSNAETILLGDLSRPSIAGGTAVSDLV